MGSAPNDPAEAAISAEHLVRRFGKFTAVNDVSFRVEKGEIFGFLGPNGSGKTTVIKMLTGLLPLSEGSAYVEGFDVRKDSEAVRENIGYMSQNFSLYFDLTVAENLTFYGRIYGLNPARLKRRIDEIVQLNDAPEMDRHLFVVFDHLKLRMIHANPLSAQSRLAKNNDPLAGSDHFLHVMQIEPPAHERFAQSVWLRFLQRCFKDFLPAAKAAQRSFKNLAAKTDWDVAFFSRKMRKLCAILVTSGKMRQQVFYSLNAEPSQGEQSRSRDPG